MGRRRRSVLSGAAGTPPAGRESVRSPGGGDTPTPERAEVLPPISSGNAACAADSPTGTQRGSSNRHELLMRRLGQREIGGERQQEDYEEERKDDIATAREVAEERAKQRATQSALEREMVAASKEEMKEVLRGMGPLPGRISELLSEVGPGGARRGLAFMEKELSTIVAALRQISASTALWPENVDALIKARLTHLIDLADWTVDLLGRGHAPRQVAELPELNLAWIEQLLLVQAHAGPDDPGSSTAALVSLPPPDEPRFPQPHGVGNKPCLVGIDGPRKKLLRWLVPPTDGEEADMRIICITGPAGVGKTTLAMELHRQTGGQYFQCHAATKQLVWFAG